MQGNDAQDRFVERSDSLKNRFRVHDAVAKLPKVFEPCRERRSCVASRIRMTGKNATKHRALRDPPERVVVAGEEEGLKAEGEFGDGFPRGRGMPKTFGQPLHTFDDVSALFGAEGLFKPEFRSSMDGEDIVDCVSTCHFQNGERRNTRFRQLDVPRVEDDCLQVVRAGLAIAPKPRRGENWLRGWRPLPRPFNSLSSALVT